MPRHKTNAPNPLPTVIGLDPATSCGWAVGFYDPTAQRAILEDSGVWDLSRKNRIESAGIQFMRLHRKLADLVNDYGWEFESDVIIAYEEVRRHAGVAAAHMYGGLEAIIQWFHHNHPNNVQFMSVPVKTAKLHATGKGNATKAKMITAARDKFHMNASLREDEADAIHIFDYAASKGLDI